MSNVQCPAAFPYASPKKPSKDRNQQEEEAERCRTPKHKRVGACARQGSPTSGKCIYMQMNYMSDAYICIWIIWKMRIYMQMNYLENAYICRWIIWKMHIHADELYVWYAIAHPGQKPSKACWHWEVQEGRGESIDNNFSWFGLRFFNFLLGLDF